MKVKKQIQKKIKDSSPTEQRFGVFIEHMDKRFDQVLEGHATLDKKIDDFRHETRSEIRVINLNLGNTSTNLKDLSVRVDRYQDETHKLLVDYFSALDDELKRMHKTLTDLGNRLIEKADREQVATIEKRVGALESQLSALRRAP